MSKVVDIDAYRARKETLEKHLEDEIARQEVNDTAYLVHALQLDPEDNYMCVSDVVQEVARNLAHNMGEDYENSGIHALANQIVDDLLSAK